MPTAALPPERIWPVILSGGSGTRLWPLSRAALPKQLLALAGPETMLVTTARRVDNAAHFQPPIVVTGAGHAAIIREQLGRAAQLIVEPMARNTAPAIALALLAVAAADPDGLLLVMPSDHQVADPAALLAAVAAAAPVARAGWLVTFGIRASAPETGYGYIRAGAEIAAGVREAASFIEKPDRARAQALLADGGYSWNSGIFLFGVAAMRAALAAHAPAVLAAATAAMAAADRAPGVVSPGAAAFEAAPSISIDHAVFEHFARVAVCPVDPGWSDIGSWDALHGLGVADAQGNVVSGQVESVDTNGCLLRADGVVLATVGVNNLNIVATPDAVLVTARGRSQDVKTVAARLAGDAVLVRPVIQHHAWGEEHVVADGGAVRVRRLVVRAGAMVEVPDGARVMLVAGSARCDGVEMAAGAMVSGGSVTSGVGAELLTFE